MTRRIGGLVLGALAAATMAAAQAPAYKVGVVSESGDIVTWFKPNGGTLVVDRVVPVGIMPADIDGPHNITVAPDMKSYFVTIAHGVPFGTLWRFDADNDSLMGKATVELFPTTIAITPDGEFAFVANSDFHGDRPRVNVVSIVHVPTMAKITDLAACDMPHGVKVNHAGTFAYVSCMNSDELLEVDINTFAISRRVKIGKGHDMSAMDHPKPAAHAPHHPASGSSPAPQPGILDKECAGTFVSVSPDDKRLYAACNYGNTVQVWDAATLTLIKEIPVGTGAYNVEPSPDGSMLLVTNKKDQSFSLIDAKTLTEVARIKSTKKIVHGVAFSPDGKYAYVSQESIGSDPGAVDVVDLATRKVTSSIPVPAQPTGITILKR
ncbi:MAG: YncE family protein [Gemmatimonadales bacterium]|nr:YncE family protein [Gemmatimonadales bacterium]